MTQPDHIGSLTRIVVSAGIALCLHSSNAMGHMQIALAQEDTSAYSFTIGQKYLFEEEDNLFLTISIERERFETGRVAATIRKLRCSYPENAKLTAVILDDNVSAKRLTAEHPHNTNSSKDTLAIRGGAVFDRTRGIAYVDFSERRGMVVKKVDLAQPIPSCTER